MFKNYRKYNISFIEVVLQRLNQLFDVGLKNNSFEYIKRKGYITNYLKYIIPGKKDIPELVKLFKIFDEGQFLLLTLPIHKFNLNETSRESSLDNVLDNLNFEIRKEIKTSYLKKIMINHDSFNDFPLLFKNKNELINFYLIKDEEIEHYFIGNLLLFPVNMDWFLLFDYDLYAIHFCHSQNFLTEKDYNEFRKIIYSDEEINHLKKEANE